MVRHCRQRADLLRLVCQYEITLVISIGSKEVELLAILAYNAMEFFAQLCDQMVRSR